MAHLFFLLVMTSIISSAAEVRGANSSLNKKVKKAGRQSVSGNLALNIWLPGNGDLEVAIKAAEAKQSSRSKSGLEILMRKKVASLRAKAVELNDKLISVSGPPPNFKLDPGLVNEVQLLKSEAFKLAPQIAQIYSLTIVALVLSIIFLTLSLIRLI